MEDYNKYKLNETYQNNTEDDTVDPNLFFNKQSNIQVPDQMLNEVISNRNYNVNENLQDFNFQIVRNGQLITEPKHNTYPQRNRNRSQNLNGLDAFLDEDDMYENLNEIKRHNYQNVNEVITNNTDEFLCESFNNQDVVSVEMFNRMREKSLSNIVKLFKS